MISSLVLLDLPSLHGICTGENYSCFRCDLVKWPDLNLTILIPDLTINLLLTDIMVKSRFHCTLNFLKPSTTWTARGLRIFTLV